jgi:hypothetical protein
VLPGFTTPKCANWIIDRFNKQNFIQKRFGQTSAVLFKYKSAWWLVQEE